MKKNKMAVLFVTGLICSISGCQHSQANMDSVVMSSSIALSTTPLKETIVPTKIPTPTVTLIPEDILTPTLVLKPMETLAPTATLTPIPTMKPVDLSKSKKIPVIYVETENEAQVFSRTEYVNCEVSVYNVGQEHMLQCATAGIRVRGNSSAYGGKFSIFAPYP